MPDKERLCSLLFISGVQRRDADEKALRPGGADVARNAAGRAVQLTAFVRTLYPNRKLPGELARYCFPYGVTPSPKPQPMRTFATAVTGLSGDRLYLHVIVYPERYGTRLWVPGAIAIAGPALLPALFRPYLEQLHQRWAAISALQAGLSADVVGAQVAADFASTWASLNAAVPLAPDIRLPRRGSLGSFEMGDSLFCFSRHERSVADEALLATNLLQPALPDPPPLRVYLDVPRAIHVPLPPGLMVQLLNLALTGSKVLVFSRSATLLTGTLEALMVLMAPFEWQYAYVPLLPDVEMLEYLRSPVPFIMGCLSSLEVAPREQISAAYVQNICPDAHCYDLDQREEVGSCTADTWPMPPNLAQALETALGEFTLRVRGFGAGIVEEDMAPPLHEATVYDRPVSFVPPEGRKGGILERMRTRPPAAAIEAGVTRDDHPLPHSKAVVPPLPEKKAPLKKEEAEERQTNLRAALTSKIDTAARWQDAENRMLQQTCDEIVWMCCPPEDNRNDGFENQLERARRAVQGRFAAGRFSVEFAENLTNAQHFQWFVQQRQPE